MADARLPYTTGPEPDTFLDAEDIRVDGDGETVLLQRTRDLGLRDGTAKVRLLDHNGVPFSPDNRLKVDVGADLSVNASFDSVISELNRIPAPLAAGATFTGQWEDVKNYAGISVAIFTDAASAVNGAIVQFTEDPAKGPLRSVATTIPANFPAPFVLAPQARYVRFVYTNGPAAQTVMRSEVALNFNAPAGVQQPLAATITDNNMASITKAHLAARAATGAWSPLLLGTGGRLGVEATAIDALLTTIRDREQREEEREIAYWASALGGRMAFNITTGIITLTGAGENELGVLVNPAGSGEDAHLDLGEFGSSANTTFRRYRNAAIAINAGQTGLAPNNMGGGTETSALRFYNNGTYVRTGGTVAKTAHIAAYQQYLAEVRGRVILRPGQSLAWTIQNSSALGSTLTASIFFEYWKRPAAA